MTLQVYEAWLPVCGKIVAMVSPECFEAQIEPKIKSLLDFKQNIRNRTKGLEMVGHAIQNMSEE